ncbi:MAG: protein kinase [Pseudomonadota bacterium]
MDLESVKAAFNKAIKLSSSERDDFVAELAVSNPELSATLVELLSSADTRDDAFLAGVVDQSLRELMVDEEDRWIGKRLGAYEITSRIAEGGMGAVFLAHRVDHAFEQRVAIKVISSRLLAPDAVERFRAERQILASLSHPNISVLLDGGATEDGVPFLVMEYVDGMRVDEYVESNTLSIDATLRLFVQLCDALDYAHRNLVVHRDIKPGNVLVDAQGVVHLLDFGVAKLLHDPAAGAPAIVTRPGGQLMTPEYSSPEQVRGEIVSVATDVYSLGVLLYRLLSGHSPYGDAAQTPEKMAYAVCETEPKRMASVVSSDVVRRRLRGELDNIVGKALRKLPAERYLSVRAFANDIQRFLEGHPVTAHAPSWFYIARKFIRRNLVSVGIGVTAAVSIAAMTLLYTVNVTKQKNIAQTQASKAAATSEFLESIFQNISPSYGPQREFTEQREVTALEVMDIGRSQLATSLQDQPAAKAYVLTLMGSVYRQLDSYNVAEQLNTQAVALGEQLYLENERSSEAAAFLCDALAVQAQNYRSMSRLEEASASLARCDAIITASGLTDPATLSQYYGGRTTIALDYGAYEEAESIARQAIETAIQADGERSKSHAARRYSLAIAIEGQERIDDARAAYDEALRVAIAAQGDGRPLVNDLRLSYARFLGSDRVRDFDAAIELAQQGLVGTQQLATGDNLQVARAYSALARVQRHAHDYAAAITAQRTAVAIFDDIRQTSSVERAASHVALGMMLYVSGQIPEAERELAPALATLEQTEGSGHGDKLGFAYSALGAIREDQQRFADAAQLYRKATAQRVAEGGINSMFARMSQEDLAWALGAQDKFEEGHQIYLDLIDTGITLLVDQPDELGRLVVTHAEWLEMMGRRDMGIAVREQWATQIAEGEAYIEYLAKQEKRRAENAATLLPSESGE